MNTMFARVVENTMFLLFYKETEDEKTVSYLIETNIYERTSVGVVKTKVKALCMFDKITKKMSFDPKRTDLYFFESPWEYPMIEAHLLDINKKSKGFPETYSIVTC